LNLFLPMNPFLQGLTPLFIASGGAAAAVIAILRLFGLKWIDKYFSQQLKQFERRQQEIILHQQYQISSLFSRVSKIHEKEYEVLPRAWMLLQDACNELKGLSNPFQTFPDLNRYTPGELAEFLEKSSLKDFQKEEILGQSDKVAFYRNAMYWIRVKVVCDVIGEFRRFLLYNRIFLSREIFSLFREIEVAIIDIQVDLENPDDPERPYHRKPSTFMESVKKINQLSEQIELAVQNRLHLSDA
jgi:predicted translin family RNA/ssDNA-binding protein